MRKRNTDSKRSYSRTTINLLFCDTTYVISISSRNFKPSLLEAKDNTLETIRRHTHAARARRNVY